TNQNSLHYTLNSTQEITETRAQEFIRVLHELQTGRPIQHILQTADFYGMRLSVNEHTLIPRPETEELVAWIIQEHQNSETLSILDIGTGSGCIAQALQKHLPHATVDAIDVEN